MQGEGTPALSGRGPYYTPRMYELRDVTEVDRDWLYALLRASMRDYVAQTWGAWDEVFQRSRFDDHFTTVDQQIIVVDGAEVGVLIVHHEATRLVLEEIQLLPDHQSRGIGTAVIGDLLTGAAVAALPVELQVLKVNPASALYERLGFAVVGETETHHLMSARPTQEHPADHGTQ